MPGGSPDSQASFRYDGAGERVAQQSTSSGTTTTTRYLLGGLEELTTTGGTSTLTKYYSVPGVVTAIKVGTTLSYLATDGLGSVSVALAAAGSTTGQALYLPYGAGRYSSGSLPTARGYTGQYQDTTSGLDYYGARYYDPVLGQFTSADSVLAGGLNRYGYVGGNPTTATDPTGHGPGDPWWSPYSISQPTNVTDPLLQRLVDQIWGHQRPPGTMVGNGGTFDALRNEAATGVQTGGRWHYIKTNDIANGLFGWLRNNGTTADPSDVSTANGLALDATDAAVAAINSPYSALIQGTPANLAATGTPPPGGGTGGGGSGGSGSGNGGSSAGSGSNSSSPSARPTTPSGSNSGSGSSTDGDGEPIEGTSPASASQPPDLEGAQRWEEAVLTDWGDGSSPTITPPTPASPPTEQTSSDTTFNPEDFGLPPLPGDPFDGDINWGAMFDDFFAALGDDGE